MDAPIASAVVLPDDPQEPASPRNGHKRRQSSVSEENAKRPRLDGDETPTQQPGSTNGASPAPPAPPARREAGRERRLFGAALGALSQNSTTTAQRRRAEIEKRQLAKRKREDEESDQKKAERAAKRKAQRLKEQEAFERDTMRLRHESLLNMAHFLKTETRPHLFYKPWETSPEEDNRIKEQIAEARATIDREVKEYDARQREQDTRHGRHAPADEGRDRDADGTHNGKRNNAGAPSEAPPTNSESNDNGNNPKDLEMRDDHALDPRREAVKDAITAGESADQSSTGHDPAPGEASQVHDDENGEEEVVEEATEDTVIY